MSDLTPAGSDAAPLEGVSNDAPAVENKEAVPDNQNEKPKTGDPRVDDPWPESARNAVNRREKALARERALRAQERKELNELRAAQEKAAREARAPKEPNEDDFTNYGEYLKALAKYKPETTEQPQAEPRITQEQALQQARETVHYEQRINVVDAQIEKAKAEYPEFGRLEAEYEDVVTSLPVPILRTLLDADDAPAAFVALAKEGKLEQLAYMTPTQAAYTIANAQQRGQQIMKAARVSKAPQPIQGAKGPSGGSKSVVDMNADELMKWMKS